MSFWIKVDVFQTGIVRAQTFASDNFGKPGGSALRVREATTVSQVLRALAAIMVTAKAETIEGGK
jgi:hypothetical protein